MRYALIALTVVAAAASALAQEGFDLPPGKWWEAPPVVAAAQLTAEQQSEIRATVFEHARRLIDLKADVDTKGLELKELADRQELDPDALRHAFAAFQQARERMATEQFELFLDVRMILSDQQWQALSRLAAERRRGDRRPPDDRRRPQPPRPGPPR